MLMAKSAWALGASATAIPMIPIPISVLVFIVARLDGMFRETFKRAK